MATIRDVAKEAGVSVATVSRVMNGSGYAHEDTKKVVMAAVEKLNYKPNEVARSLYNRKSKLVGLILPDITNPFFPEMARGVEDYLQQFGYRLIFGNSDEKRDKEIEYIDTFLQNNVVGMIASTSEEPMKILITWKFQLSFLTVQQKNYQLFIPIKRQAVSSQHAYCLIEAVQISSSSGDQSK